MASTVVTKAVRLVDMMRRLKERPYTTQQLCELYGVSPRTVQRDLLTLEGEPFYVPLERIYCVTGMAHGMERG